MADMTAVPAQTKGPLRTALEVGAGRAKDKEALKGLGKKPTVVMEYADVGVPPHTAYDQWTRFQDSGSFAKGVKSADRADDSPPRSPGSAGAAPVTALRYVYAVCPPFETPLQADLTGVVGEPPARLAHGHLVAVVSRVPEDDFAEKPLRRRPEDLDRLTGTAHAHERVVDATPLRLATVFRDDSGVRTMLEEGETRFRHVLERIAGRDHLRQRRRAALSGEESWHRGELFSERLHSALCSPADAVCLRPPRNSPASPTEQNVFNAAFPVRREFSASFMEIADGSWTSSGST